MNVSLYGSIAFDWFILGLRIAFIALIYYFLYRVARVSMRELVEFGAAQERPERRPIARSFRALEVIVPGGSSRTEGDLLELGPHTSIGRHQQNSMRLDDTSVSGRHAEIVFEGGDWWLHDLNSTNHSYVNGTRVRDRMRLGDGDVVQFGGVRLRVHI